MGLNFGKLNRAVAFNPTTAFPLDARSYFEDIESANDAASSAKLAGDTTTVYYNGMIITVTDPETNIAKAYIISNGALEEVGSSVEVESIDEDYINSLFPEIVQVSTYTIEQILSGEFEGGTPSANSVQVNTIESVLNGTYEEGESASNAVSADTINSILDGTYGSEG